MKKQFEIDLSHKAKENPKAIWQFINSKSKNRVKLGELYIDPKSPNNGTTLVNKEKADILGTFFSSVFTVEGGGPVPTLPPINCHTDMTTLKVTEEHIIKVLNKLKPNKSPGPDKLHPRLLHEIRSSLTYPLSILFNQSISEGTIPNDWRMAQITAIYKKGDRKSANNYRPIALTSVVCKIMETIVRDHITTYMKSNNLFSNKQYGFISGRSTSLQLLNVWNHWTEALDQGFKIDCIYIWTTKKRLTPSLIKDL